MFKHTALVIEAVPTSSDPLHYELHLACKVFTEGLPRSATQPETPKASFAFVLPTALSPEVMMPLLNELEPIFAACHAPGVVVRPNEHPIARLAHWIMGTPPAQVVTPLSKSEQAQLEKARERWKTFIRYLPLTTTAAISANLIAVLSSTKAWKNDGPIPNHLVYAGFITLLSAISCLAGPLVQYGLASQPPSSQVITPPGSAIVVLSQAMITVEDLRGTQEQPGALARSHHGCLYIPYGKALTGEAQVFLNTALSAGTFSLPGKRGEVMTPFCSLVLIGGMPFNDLPSVMNASGRYMPLDIPPAPQSTEGTHTPVDDGSSERYTRVLGQLPYYRKALKTDPFHPFIGLKAEIIAAKGHVETIISWIQGGYKGPVPVLIFADDPNAGHLFGCGKTTFMDAVNKYFQIRLREANLTLEGMRVIQDSAGNAQVQAFTPERSRISPETLSTVGTLALGLICLASYMRVLFSFLTLQVEGSPGLSTDQEFRLGDLGLFFAFAALILAVISTTAGARINRAYTTREPQVLYPPTPAGEPPTISYVDQPLDLTGCLGSRASSGPVQKQYSPGRFHTQVMVIESQALDQADTSEGNFLAKQLTACVRTGLANLGGSTLSTPFRSAVLATTNNLRGLPEDLTGTACVILMRYTVPLTSAPNATSSQNEPLASRVAWAQCPQPPECDRDLFERQLIDIVSRKGFAPWTDAALLALWTQITGYQEGSVLIARPLFQVLPDLAQKEARRINGTLVTAEVFKAAFSQLEAKFPAIFPQQTHHFGFNLA